MAANSVGQLVGAASDLALPSTLTRSVPVPATDEVEIPNKQQFPGRLIQYKLLEGSFVQVISNEISVLIYVVSI